MWNSFYTHMHTAWHSAALLCVLCNDLNADVSKMDSCFSIDHSTVKCVFACWKGAKPSIILFHALKQPHRHLLLCSVFSSWLRLWVCAVAVKGHTGGVGSTCWDSQWIVIHQLPLRLLPFWSCVYSPDSKTNSKEQSCLQVDLWRSHPHSF